MKSTLLSLLSFFVASFSFSQSLSLVSGDTYVKGFVDESLIESHAHILNTTGSDVNAKLRRTVISETKYTQNNFCWGPTCYPDFVSESPTPNAIPAGETDSTFRGDYSPNGQHGTTTVHYLIYNASDETDSIGMTVTFEAFKLPEISGSLTYCSGDLTTLDAGAGYDSYLWSTGATTQTIAVTAGSYSCEVTIDSETRMSDTVTVTQTNNYTPQILGDLNYCENGSTTLDAGTGYAGYLWSDNNQTTQSISATQGTYTVTVTSGNGCTGTTSVTVNEIANPSVPDIAWNGTILSTTATGDYITWYKDGNVVYGEHDQTYEPEGNGDYEVEVCDTSACCCTKSQVETLNNVGLSEVITNSNWKLYPNPAKHNLTVESTSQIESVTIYSLLGQRVYYANTNGNNRVNINVEKLSVGTYVFAMSYTNGEIVQEKFTINK